MQVVKNLLANAEDSRGAGLIPGLGRSPRVGNDNLLQYSYLKNSMDRGDWWATVHGVVGCEELDVMECAHAHTHRHTHTP